MNQLRVVLADDYPQILTLLRSLLEPEYRVVGTAENGCSLIDTVQALQPDFVLTDINMPVMNGIDAIRQLRRIHPDMCLIVHSARRDMMAAAYEAGASGYVIKGPAESLLASVRTFVAHLRKPLGVTSSAAAPSYRPPSGNNPIPWPHQNA